MRLIIIRHLPTEWNLAGKLQGSNDIPVKDPEAQMLDKIAANQAEITTRYPQIDKVFVSPLQRTQQTARHYGYQDFMIEPLLTELNFGQFEGRLKAEMVESLGEAWVENPQTLTLGEPLSALAQRVRDFFEKYAHLDTVLALGHGSWMRAALSLQQVGDLSMMNKIVVENNQLAEISSLSN